ncbi:DUF4811 domain-containing protein [Lacticaseibacillus jixiensis]|uniref:DUF4811 domain-containing protein n=1 Tax=Lacticaseibacillus jixiensis TaxID=3231926 RepID=UPI0036F2CB91
MILALFIIAALGFFYHRVLDTHQTPRLIGSIATGAVIVLSVAAIAANDAWHFGMTTTTTTKRVMLVKQPVIRHAIGTKDAAYRHTTAQGPAVAKPTLSDTVVLKRTKTQASVTTSTQTLHYANGLAKVMFAGSSLDGHRLSRTITVNVPTTWQIVNK